MCESQFVLFGYLRCYLFDFLYAACHGVEQEGGRLLFAEQIAAERLDGAELCSVHFVCGHDVVIMLQRQPDAAGLAHAQADVALVLLLSGR